MRNVASVSSDESSIFDSFLTWMIIDQVCSAAWSMISWWVKFFLLSFITFRKNVQMSIIPSPCSFSFAHWLLFLFLIKQFAYFEKLIRFRWQALIAYKKGENLKMLTEIFCQKLIVSNVILAFLDHPKPKIFFVGQPWWPT